MKFLNLRPTLSHSNYFSKQYKSSISKNLKAKNTLDLLDFSSFFSKLNFLFNFIAPFFSLIVSIKNFILRNFWEFYHSFTLIKMVYLKLPTFKTGVNPTIRAQYDMNNLAPSQKLDLVRCRIFGTNIGKQKFFCRDIHFPM